MSRLLIVMVPLLKLRDCEIILSITILASRNQQGVRWSPISPVRQSPFDGGGTGLHRHDCEFQFGFVLNGWARFQFEDQGEVTIRAGSCVNRPPEIRHNLIEYSDVFEVLELVAPADFGTENLGDDNAKAVADYPPPLEFDRL